MRERLNCPNCGAPIIDTECPYCGTLFYDFASIDLDKPTYIRIKRGNELITAKAQCTEFKLDWRNEREKFYADDCVCHVERETSMSVEMCFDVLKTENGALLTLRH